MAKIKLPKNPLIHISVKTDVFALVENTIILALSILTGFDINFLENAWSLIAGSPREMIKQYNFKSYHAMSRF